jgi:3D (Asp-Asp-Asp) domain-containing protein
MRIISMLVALPFLWTTLIPQYQALAAEVTNTDEIKTKFEIQESIEIVAGVAQMSYKKKERMPMMSPEYVAVKSQDELYREKVLEKYQEKIAVTVFPQGKFMINASAYTAAADECGKSDGITASGLKVKEKHTIACPPAFPLGTKIKIENYGVYVCEDRGGAIKNNHIDVYMKTKKEAFAFGRRSLLAEVVN